MVELEDSDVVAFGETPKAGIGIGACIDMTGSIHVYRRSRLKGIKVSSP